MEKTHDNEDNNNEKIMNVFFVEENGKVIDINNSVVDKSTPIYQVLGSDEFPKGISRRGNIESITINLY